MRVYDKKTKGFVGIGLSLIFLVGISLYFLIAQSSERARLNQKVEQTQLRYYAESVVDLQMGLIKNKLDNIPALFVTYMASENPLTGDLVTLPIESSYIFDGTEEEMYEICGEAVQILTQSAPGDRYAKTISAKMAVKDKSADDLKLHKLDKNEAFSGIDNAGFLTGKLAELDFQCEVAFMGGALSTVFTLSDIEFEQISSAEENDGPYSVLMLKLSTDNMKIKYKKFELR